MLKLFLYFSISLITGFFGAYLYELFAKKVLRKDSFIVGGYRLHHSLYGLAGLFASIWLALVNQNLYSAVLLGFSLGIITQHTITDGCSFISKEST